MTEKLEILNYKHNILSDTLTWKTPSVGFKVHQPKDWAKTIVNLPIVADATAGANFCGMMQIIFISRKLFDAFEWVEKKILNLKPFKK